MKSSTIRRSTLSKESMEVIENLAKEQEDNGLPEEYVRPDELEKNESETESVSNKMSQEIDLLWQNFKPAQFNTNSPALNVAIGIVIGVIATLLVLFCINALSNNNSGTDKKSGVLGIEKVIPAKKDNTAEPTLEQQAGYEQNNQGQETASNENEETINSAGEEQGEQTSSENTDTSKMTKYVVKNGDTVEMIIKNHYGSYTPERAEMVRKANKMQTLDRINIDQEILLP